MLINNTTMLHFLVYMKFQWFLCVFFGSIFNEEYPPITEEDALAKWAADPANTAWMESKRENLYLMERMQLLVIRTCLCTESLCLQANSRILPSLLFWGSRYCRSFSFEHFILLSAWTNFWMFKITHSSMWLPASGPDDVIYDDVPRENSDSNTG